MYVSAPFREAILYIHTNDWLVQNEEEPDSALIQGPKPEFTSRYADPNHPANEGSLVALLTGGNLTQKQIFRHTGAGFAYYQGKKVYTKHKEKRDSERSSVDETARETTYHIQDGEEVKPKETGLSDEVKKVTNKLKKVSFSLFLYFFFFLVCILQADEKYRK